MTATPPRRAAVLGHPIAHSLSPVLHRAAYEALGLRDWTYESQDVTQEQLAGVLAGLDEGWAGLSLTMPLKQVVIPLLDHVEPLAAAVGAVNTVLVDRVGTARALVGANTDVPGIVAAVREAAGGAAVGGPALLLGTGATAASALAALAELGVADVSVLARSPARAAGLLRAAGRLRLSPRVLAWDDDGASALTGAGVVVSTVPAGATDALAARLVADGAGVRGVLLDVVYAPWPTPLARAWAEAGGTLAPGWAMLLHQAAEQVRLMTGHDAPVEAMRAALVAALDARTRA